MHLKVIEKILIINKKNKKNRSMFNKNHALIYF